MNTNNDRGLKSRCVTVIIVLVLLVAAFPISAFAISGSEFDNKLNSLRNAYPNYSTWTDTYAGGTQCWGFARLIADKVFGGNSSSWPQVNSISGVKRGDIVQYGNTTGNGHTIFVTNVSGNTITFVDCNGNGNYSGATKVRSCGIKWDNTISKSAAMFGKYSFSYLLSSPGVDIGPRGYLDGMSAENGKVHVEGWAFDDDTPNQAVRVHVYIGGRAGDSKSKCYDIGLAEVQRESSVGKHGFNHTFDTDIAGMQEVYIYLLDTSGTGYTELGPYQLLIPIPDDYLLDSTVYNDAFYAEQNESVRNMTTAERKQHWITTGSYQGLQASPAFFAIEYRNLHSDLDREYGASNYQLYIKHFIEHGIGEFRSGRNMFNPAYYKENYKDLKDNFKNDNKCYYIHFADAGYNEGRVADHRLKVYFDTSNGGSSSEQEREMTIGQALGTLPTLTRQGYTGAWYTAKSGGTKVTSGYVPAGTKDLRIYAQWTPNVVKVTGISIPRTQTVSIGESKTLTVTVTPSNATNKSVTWKSSDTSVVTVTNGTIRGVKEGTATVTATASDGSGVSANCTVTVKPTVTGLTLNRSSIRLADSGIGSSYILKAEKSPAGGQGTIKWSTSNSGVVQVTQDGVVTAKGTGTATVTAAITNGPAVTCTVSVSSMSLMTLPSGLKSIEEEAFLNTASSRIEIPSGVESIGARAFADSQALRYVRVPDSVVTIADSAFADAPNLCLICGKNSKAKEYAVSHGIDYIENTVTW